MSTEPTLRERVDAMSRWVKTATFPLGDIRDLLDATERQRAALTRIEALAEDWRIGTGADLDAALAALRYIRDEARGALGEPS